MPAFPVSLASPNASKGHNNNNYCIGMHLNMNGTLNFQIGSGEVYLL